MFNGAEGAYRCHPFQQRYHARLLPFPTQTTPSHRRHLAGSRESDL